MKDNISQVTPSHHQLREIWQLCHAAKQNLDIFLLDEIFSLSPELLTKEMNFFVDKIIDHTWFKATSILVTPRQLKELPKGTNQHFQDTTTQSFKDTNGNYIICPTHPLEANVTSISMTIKDKIIALVYLVIWS